MIKAERNEHLHTTFTFPCEFGSKLNESKGVRVNMNQVAGYVDPNKLFFCNIILIPMSMNDGHWCLVVSVTFPHFTNCRLDDDASFLCSFCGKVLKNLFEKSMEFYDPTTSPNQKDVAVIFKKVQSYLRGMYARGDRGAFKASEWKAVIVTNEVGHV